MERRAFLKLSAAALATAAVPPLSLLGQTAPTSPAGAGDPRAQFDRYFLPIVEGFLRNARATSADFVVCDYRDGTKLKSCCTPSGKTYVSVARMLPPMVEWLRSRRMPTKFRAGDAEVELSEVLLSIFRHAFDPRHPDFWGYAPANKATQLSVEAALVASALHNAGEDFVAKLTPQQRTNVQKWLASCTQVPERKTNHAWFSATNQACRLALSKRFPEFSGDEPWMLEDLKAMDELGARGTAEGWCSDAPDQPIYDIYNFYVFPNFPLMWGRIIGERYPQWNEKFHARVKTFLQTAPLFFAANGNHPLMGRSLIYRWAVLSPLVLGYRDKLWPHSPGLLRRIVRGQLEYHWSHGCFDAPRGKLRETYSAAGTPVTREPYVDNGHPYWAMLGFAFLSIPKDDPFWTAKEEPLPVEKGDYVQRFDGPKFLVSGNKATGEVRWIQAQNSAKRDAYRDKYSKFAWSSHFGFNAVKDADNLPPDQALVFREIATGKEATRAPNGVTEGKLLDDGSGVETKWWAQLGDWKFEVTSRVRLIGEFEERTHQVAAPPEAVGKVELLEATYSLGDGGKPVDTTEYMTASDGGKIGLWRLAGYDRAERQNLRGANLINEESYFLTALGPLKAARATFATLTYASPRRPDWDDVKRRGDELAKQWKA